MPARYLLSSRVRLSVRLSDCPSQVGVVQKRSNMGSRKQSRTIAEDSMFHGAEDLYEIPIESTAMGLPNAGGVGKNFLFRSVAKSPA